MTEIAFQMLIWLGSGFAFAIGVTLGVFLTCLVTRRGDKATEAVNELLRERNQIGEQQEQAIVRIACAIENYSRK